MSTLDVSPAPRLATGRPPGPAYDPDRVAEALRQHNGLVYLTASVLKIAPNTIYAYARQFPAVQEALEDARGKMLDIAESALFAAILAKEAWAIQFALRTIGRHRGYVEKQVIENTGPGGGPLQTVTVSVNAADLAKLSDDELEQYEKLVQKLAGEPSAREQITQ